MGKAALVGRLSVPQGWTEAAPAIRTLASVMPANLAAADDLRNLLNLNEVVVQLAPQSTITELLGRIYLGKEESIIDLISELENNPALGGAKHETSIDLASLGRGAMIGLGVIVVLIVERVSTELRKRL